MMKFYILAVKNQVNITCGPQFNNKYSFESACKKCGTGAVLISPRFIKSFNIPKYKMFFTLDAEIFLQKDIKDLLTDNGINSIGEIYDFKTKKQINLWELRAQAVLPPFSSETTGYEKELPCSFCNRDGYFGTVKAEFKLVYKEIKDSLLEKDILATYECFGNSRLRDPMKDSVFATPLFVVSHKVMECLKYQIAGEVDFEPVEIQ